MRFGFIDFETTGLDAMIDEIIEVGITMVNFGDLSMPGQVTDIYGGFRDTDVPISIDAAEVHHITEEDIRGKVLPMDYIHSLLDGTDYCVAHNAPFDYQMAAQSDDLSWLTDLPWLDSLRHIDWVEHGHKTRTLNYIAADMGFINPFAHRAAMDTLTNVRVVEGCMEEMIETSKQEIVTIKAYKTQFSPSLTAILKSMGFRWYPKDSLDDKHWWVETTPAKAREFYEGGLRQVYDVEWKFKANLKYSSITWEEYLKNYKTV